VDSVNVSVLAYVPVRSGSFARHGGTRRGEPSMSRAWRFLDARNIPASGA